jgi:hypothetical protein
MCGKLSVALISLDSQSAALRALGLTVASGAQVHAKSVWSYKGSRGKNLKAKQGRGVVARALVSVDGTATPGLVREKAGRAMLSARAAGDNVILGWY